jgi:hypothetical protein
MLAGDAGIFGRLAKGTRRSATEAAQHEDADKGARDRRRKGYSIAGLAPNASVRDQTEFCCREVEQHKNEQHDRKRECAINAGPQESDGQQFDIAAADVAWHVEQEQQSKNRERQADVPGHARPFSDDRCVNEIQEAEDNDQPVGYPEFPQIDDSGTDQDTGSQHQQGV